jgi:hypothetical protein
MSKSTFRRIVRIWTFWRKGTALTVARERKRPGGTGRALERSSAGVNPDRIHRLRLDSCGASLPLDRRPAQVHHFA